MGVFSLDIEKFYEELEENGEQLKGIFCLQYPIYCIHAHITDNTSDPLDNLDKAIAEFLLAKKNFTPFQISSLMGTSKPLVELRIAKMIDDRLLIQQGEIYELTGLGIEVFQNKTQIRQHKRSYDFYVDGLTLMPLPKIFYTHYNSKLISEHDFYFRTISNGESKVIRPFGPDLTHKPLNKSEVIERIFNVPSTEREKYFVPEGLVAIDDTSFTKLAIHLFVSVSQNGEKLNKQVIDGFAIYSLAENITYYETVTRNVKSFESILQQKINNLEFKIAIPRQRPDSDVTPRPMLTTNWPEIDKYANSGSKCFSFSSEDLLRVVEQIFQIRHVVDESLINTDTDVVISINKKMLLSSPNRQKIISDLIRERDYKFGNVDNNVFLLYLYFKTDDDFVKKAIDLKKIITAQGSRAVSLTWLIDRYPEFAGNYRQLLIAAGEYDLLEKLDIEKFMMQIN
jgi:hypothetical protein